MIYCTQWNVIIVHHWQIGAVPCVHGALVFAAALWGQMQMLEEKQPSCCEWLVYCPLGEGGDPTPHAYKPLCFGAARSHQVWTETEDRILMCTDNCCAIIWVKSCECQIRYLSPEYSSTTAITPSSLGNGGHGHCRTWSPYWRAWQKWAHCWKEETLG